MKFILSLFIAVLVCSAISANAQWQKVAYIVSPFYPRIQTWLGPLQCGGAITYKDGILWAGYNELSYSPDTGKHWFPTSFGDRAIVDISFLNRDTGAVASDSTVLITYDGGKTWMSSPAFGVPIMRVYFKPNTDSLFVDVPGMRGMPYSTDCGTTWLYYGWDFFALDYAGNDLAVTRRGSIFLFTAANAASYSPITLTLRPYNGTTWSQGFSALGSDIYSLGLDSCNTSRLYAVQEDYYSQQTDPPTDPNSDIYVTTNAGQQWDATFSHPVPYLSGSFTCSKHAQYAGTVANGIFRSTDHGLTWQNIGGPTNKPDCRCLFAIDDNLVVALDSLGNFWWTNNSGGTPVPAIDDRVTTSTDTLFAHDTLMCQKYLWRGVGLRRTTCSPSIVSADPTNYIDYGTQFGANTDSIQVVFRPSRIGTIHDTLQLVFSDGTIDTVYLEGTNAGSEPFYADPDTLFVKDTLFCAGPIDKTVMFHHVNCGTPVTIQSVSVVGSNPGNYQFHGLTQDSVTVEFDPLNTGASRGILLLQRDDGKTDSVLLRGISKIQPFQYSTSRSSLFQHDTLSFCEGAVQDTVAFQFSGCKPNILSQQITGVATGDYTAMRLLASPLLSNDTIILSFLPSSPGLRTATLEVTLDNGSTVTIPLSGSAAGGKSLSITTADVGTDTLGGDVAVPITIEGLDQPVDVDLSLHYSGTIVYQGSTSSTGAILDIPGAKQPGRSKLHITQAAPDAIAGFARFTVFNDSLTAASVTFDSLQLSAAVKPCDYVLSQNSAVATIGMLNGCQVPVLSRYIHFGEFPLLTFVPNPTTGSISITCDRDLGTATITVIDGLGTVRFHAPYTFAAHSPTSIDLPRVAGVYEVRIESAAGNSSSRIAVIR